MLSRPPARCRLVQRPRPTPLDSIWISDEVLYSVFRQFCTPPRAARRHGSSVPGPMESRRRLGKRRMTHISEAVPTPLPNPMHMWSLFGTPDRTQWRWEAPTPRPLGREDGAAAALPTWLAEWDATGQDGAVEGSRDDAADEECLAEDAPTIEDDVGQFRKTLKSNADPEAHISGFNQKIKQNLTLGLVSSDLLGSMLQKITDDLRETSKDHQLSESRCLAFYSAVWDGITASKVIRPGDFHGKTMDGFISLLARLPSSHEVQILAHHILSSTSTTQLQSMEQGIVSLVKAWSHSWITVPLLPSCLPDICAAEECVMAADNKLISAQRLATTLENEPNSDVDLPMVREAMPYVRAALSQAMESLARVEEIISPLKASARLLANALQNVPRDMFLGIISSCSGDITLHGGRRKDVRTLRYCWLSMLAQSSHISTELFVQTWQNMESHGGIPENEASDLMLDHWISQGYVVDVAGVRNSFEAAVPRAGKEDFASLLFALDKHRQNSLTRTRELFDLLDKLGKYKKVYPILARMKDLGLKVPMTSLGRSIETMSNYDARLALRVYHLHRAMILGDRRIRLDWIPNFIIALINDRSIAPKQIWEILGIPMYEYLPPSRRHFKPTPLSQTKINLVHKMALAFAHSEARPKRVALRNVLQCLYHLRLHRAPITPELSRAMSRAGITQEINDGRWIGPERLRYTLRLINEVEGKEVADTVDVAVMGWRQHLCEKQARQGRQQNALRVGLID